MLGIVLPRPTSVPSGSSVAVSDVAAPYVGVSVHVAVEVVVVVNCDIVVPSPTTAPTPASAPHRTHRDSNAEGNGRACHVMPRRGINDRWIGVDRRRCSIHHGGVRAWNIDHLRVGLLDHNHALRFHGYRFNLHLLIRFQLAPVLGLPSHALYGGHYVRLLRQERVPQL